MLAHETCKILESKIKELEEENKRLETEIKVISVDDQQEISKLKKENEELRSLCIEYILGF